MGKETGIAWTDHTHNIVWGCQEASEGCTHCYARTLATRWGFDVWGKDAPRRIMSDAYWRHPLEWNLLAQKEGRPHRVFTSSMADVFEDHPDVARQRPRLFKLIEVTSWLRWQILTKRPEHILTMVPQRWLAPGGWPANAWIMTSAENQRQANLRLPWLFEVRATTACPVLGVSAEPLLGPVDFDSLAYLDPLIVAKMLRGTHGKDEALALADRWDRLWSDLFDTHGYFKGGDGPPCLTALDDIDWVITGGESGPKHRPIDVGWVRSIRDQCQDAEIAFFHKQWGGSTPKTNGKELDGREWCEFPDARPAAELALP